MDPVIIAAIITGVAMLVATVFTILLRRSKSSDISQKENSNIDVYARGIELVFRLGDTFIGYSQDPPSRDYDDYEKAEQSLKDWLFANKVTIDSGIAKMVQEFIGTIRNFVATGNKFVFLLGGDGRPTKEMLVDWEKELFQKEKALESKIRQISQ